MEESSSYFRISPPCAKEVLVEHYRETTGVIQLLLFPFGVDDAVANILGVESAVAIVAPVYKKLEESISRRLHKWKGLSEEHLVSALYQYVEKEQDQELLNIMNGAASGAVDIIHPRALVELPTCDSRGNEFNKTFPLSYKSLQGSLASPDICIQLLDNVIKSISECYSAFYDYLNSESEEPKKFADMHELDSIALEKYGIVVPRTPFDPIMLSSQLLHAKVLSDSALNLLNDALVATVNHEGSEVSVRFTTSQYYFILALNGTSQIVNDHLGKSLESISRLNEKITVGSHFVSESARNEDGDGDENINPTRLSDLRSCMYKLNPLTIPLFSYVSQAASGIKESKASETSKPLQDTLIVTVEAIDLLLMAGTQMEFKEYEKAIELLTSAIEKKGIPLKSGMIGEDVGEGEGDDEYDEGDDDDEGEGGNPFDFFNVGGQGFGMGEGGDEEGGDEEGDEEDDGEEDGEEDENGSEEFGDDYVKSEGAYKPFSVDLDEDEERDRLYRLNLKKSKDKEEGRGLAEQGGDSDEDNDDDDENEDNVDECDDNASIATDDLVDLLLSAQPDLEASSGRENGSNDESIINTNGISSTSIESSLDRRDVSGRSTNNNNYYRSEDKAESQQEPNVESKTSSSGAKKGNLGTNTAAAVSDDAKTGLANFEKGSAADYEDDADGDELDAIKQIYENRIEKDVYEDDEARDSAGNSRDGEGGDEDDDEEDEGCKAADYNYEEFDDQFDYNEDDDRVAAAHSQKKDASKEEGEEVKESPAESEDRSGWAPDAYIPIDLLCQLHSLRGSCYEAKGDFENASKDADIAISLNKRFGPAYKVRSACNAASEELRGAAIDGMAAFLLGGSSDLELAGTAEVAISQSCRVAAQALYEERLKTLQNNSENDDSSSSSSGAACQTVRFPKTWLVKSYFAGYELLSDAMGVLPKSLGEGGGRVNSAKWATKRSSDSGEGGGSSSDDIDGGESNSLSLLPPPPVHLRDVFDETNTSTSDGDNEGGGDGEGEACGYVERANDRGAYDLLRNIIELFDSYFDGNNLEGSTAAAAVGSNSISSSNTSSSGGSDSAEEQKSIYSTDTSKNVTVPVLPDDSSDLLSAVNALGGLIDVGICKVGTNHFDATASFSSSTASLSATNSSGDGSKSSNESMSELPGGHICQSFRAALNLLRTSDALSITGVHFKENGGIFKIEKRIINADLGEENVIWEDCDEDDEEEVDDEEEEDEEVEDEGAEEFDITDVSRPLRARLLNICASIAYLSGDSAAAVECLKTSIMYDSKLMDSHVKLGALLVDMDQLEEANTMFGKAALLDKSSAFLKIHVAELDIHKNDFESAIETLKVAERYCSDPDNMASSASSKVLTLKTNLIKSSNNGASKINTAQLNLFEDRRRNARSQLLSNLYSLHGLALFRDSPNDPRQSITILRKGLKLFPSSLYINLSLGEIMSQSGDIVFALTCFKTASQIDPFCPLPYINASRVYQQLNQNKLAGTHLSKAMSLDDYFAMTKVDLAQFHMSTGRTNVIEILNQALSEARHVSEIRDVLSAIAFSKMQVELISEGIYIAPSILDDKL